MASNSPPRRPTAPLPSSFDYDPKFYDESGAKKIWRRIREEPLIPLGLILTISAFVGAVRAIKKGESKKANVMFYRRCYAQGFTVLAMVGGNYYWKGDRKKRKEYEQMVTERKAAERRDAWLRELEARDAEEQAFEERMARSKAVLEKREKERVMNERIGRGVPVSVGNKDEVEGTGTVTAALAGTSGTPGTTVASSSLLDNDEPQKKKEPVDTGTNDSGIRKRRMRGKLADAMANSGHTPDTQQQQSQGVNIADAIRHKAVEKARQTKEKAIKVVKDSKEIAVEDKT